MTIFYCSYYKIDILCYTGQKGSGVTVKESDLEGDDLQRYKKGYEVYLYNSYVSDLIPLRRSFPPDLLEKEYSMIYILFVSEENRILSIHVLVFFLPIRKINFGLT